MEKPRERRALLTLLPGEMSLELFFFWLCDEKDEWFCVENLFLF